MLIHAPVYLLYATSLFIVEIMLFHFEKEVSNE